MCSNVMSESPIVKIDVGLGELAEPATRLIDVCSDAVGGIFAPWQIRRVAASESEADLMRARTEVEIDSIKERAKTRSLGEEMAHQANIESIVAKAIQELDPVHASPENMEIDWVANFFDKARIVSDQDMQTLWAKILAGEGNASGSFSRKTVNVLADLGKRDAKVFANLCRFVWTIGDDTVPLIYEYDEDIYKRNAIDSNSVVRLNELDLISDGASFFSPELTQLANEVIAQYFDDRFVLHFSKEAGNSLAIGGWIFTQTGKELSTLVEPAPIDGFADYVVGQWVSRKKVEVTKLQDDEYETQPDSKSASMSILEMFDQIHESVPESAWDNVPTDGAINYKHYLYGWPKVETE